MQIRITQKDPEATVQLGEMTENGGILTVPVSWSRTAPAVPQPFRLTWYCPVVDCYSMWHPGAQDVRHIMPSYRKQTAQSRLAWNMPVFSAISRTGRNRFTIAMSDAMTPMTLAVGVVEETACFECEVEVFTNLTAARSEYHATLRIDTRDIPFGDAVQDVSRWWETDCGYTPMHVPDAARMPMNSLWYSMHRELVPDEIVKQCELSREYGMDTVLIDDGWQTDAKVGGYSCCGDWKLAKKIPDMRALVGRIHATGMKCMVWFSVPFMGELAEIYSHFEDMMLDVARYRTLNWKVLDPRYPEVRQFLIDLYVRSVRDWDLDGLKLDFIDQFKLEGKALEDDPRRDYVSLEEALDRLMTDITTALQAIRPEVLIEFRQSYVGPAIRKYGNMLRVGDCPNDPIRNRVGIVDLRLTSGRTAVHSDMLMWHTEDSAEGAATQLAGCLYAVPQISVLLDRLPKDHRRMLKYYLTFWRAHRDVLLDGRFTVTSPENGYSQVCSEKDGTAVLTVYTDPVVRQTAPRLVAVNVTPGTDLFFIGRAGQPYRVVNCMGDEVACGTFGDEPVAAVSVPLCGMVTVG